MPDRKNPTTLGIVAISYNEEVDLPGFIQHLISWVDEIIIIDDGSKDKTADIAKASGEKVKFFVSKRIDGEYFSHQRNKGIEAAKSDWLLHMDIDERVTPEFAEEIRAAIMSGVKSAYRFRRLNYFLHKAMNGGGWQNWNQVHLARREVLSFAGMYHETVNLTVGEEKIGQLHRKMWHLNDDTYAERIRKSNLYCKEQAAELMEKKKIIRWYHFLYLPLREFVRIYFFKKGFLDGTLGLLFSLHASTAKFRACALVWDAQNLSTRNDLEDLIREKWLHYASRCAKTIDREKI